MSKPLSYVVVGVLAFLGGSLSVLLADHGGTQPAESKPLEGRPGDGGFEDADGVVEESAHDTLIDRRAAS